MKYQMSDYDNCVIDLLTNQSVNSMSQFIQHGNVSCLKHCQAVSYYSYIICRLFKLDYRSAARGGLLHDYFLYDWHNSSDRLHGIRHPIKSLLNAQRDFELTVIESDIIRKHMWPLTITPPRYFESLIVGCVDKCCTVVEFIKPFLI